MTQSSDNSSSVSATVRHVGGQSEYSVVNGQLWSIDSASDTVVEREAGYSAELGTSVGYIALRKNLSNGMLWVDSGTDIEAPTTETGSGVPQDVQSGDQIVGLSCLGSSCSTETAQGTLNGVQGTFTCPGSCSIQFGGLHLSSASGGIDFTGATFNGLEVGVDTFDVASAMGIVFTSESTTQAVTDSDYLSLGTWEFYPSDPADDAAFAVGAFADGNDPFEQSNLRALVGNATYQGLAGGMSMDGSGELEYFDSNVTLTADFGDGSALGAISGRVHDFTADGVPIPGNPELLLNSAGIGGQNSGFFSGDTSATFSGSQYSGKWGGQFFGNGEAASDAPGSVAGTFGAAATDGTGAILGAFGAHKQ